jgi:ankyrin repeat protein
MADDFGATSNEARVPHGHKPLLIAARDGDEPAVKRLIEEQYVGTNETDDDIRTPLWWAADRGYASVVKLLLGVAAVDPNRKDRHGVSPLFASMMEGHADVVELFIGRDDVDLEQGGLLLLSALAEGNMRIVNMLFDTGRVQSFLSTRDHHLNIHYEEEEVWEELPPLSWAVQNGCDKIFETLLEKEGKYKIDYNWEDSCGYTALFEAIERSDVSIIKRLLRIKGVASYKNKYGETPLTKACNIGSEEIV